MKAIYLLLLTTILFIVSGCSGSISGTVVDADTGQPVEGAVVLVEWTKTSGKWIGLRSTSSYKVVEMITDKEGIFSALGVLNPFVDPPRLTIYKKGYVAWNNEFIFPGFKKRSNFHWQSGYIFRLNRFEQEYKYSDHIFFIHSAVRLGMGDKKLITSAIGLEEAKAFEERQKDKK